VSRLPILVKLTAAFAAAMLLMLGIAAVFVYLRLRADLDDRVNANLRARAAAAAVALADRTDIESVAVEDPEESFAQVLTGDRLLESAGLAIGPALTPEEVSAALRSDLVVERPVPGIDGTARILAVRYASADGPVVLAIGQSLTDRNEALSSVVTSFLVGGGFALVAASIVGYGLARSGLAPVEAMRVRASQISATDDIEGLPLPVARDQIRRLAETLNDMLRRLRDSYQRERRFVDDASHELRTPLAVIQTDLEVALLAGGHAPSVEAALTSALDETHRLIRTAEDLLVLARAAGGQLPLATRPLPVLDLLGWAHRRFSEIARDAARTISVTTTSDLLVVTADQDRMRQVLTNLVDNALRHGSGDITLAGYDADGGVTIEVRDEGPGFSASFAPRAFDRLTRADQAHRLSGAGLGLAIVDAIVTAHGGIATSAVGRPAIVSVWLPGRPQA
jgi:signal transduction histidine kinase